MTAPCARRTVSFDRVADRCDVSRGGHARAETTAAAIVSAAAAELSGQAEELADLVASFRIERQEVSAGPIVPARPAPPARLSSSGRLDPPPTPSRWRIRRA